MVTSLVVHFSPYKSAHPALQDDRPMPESTETEECNQTVRHLCCDHVDPLIEPLLRGLISVLCLLIVLSGYTFRYGHRIRDPLDVGSPPPTVRLDRAVVVGKNQGRTEIFQGIPYARPPWVPFRTTTVYSYLTTYAALGNCGSANLNPFARTMAGFLQLNLDFHVPRCHQSSYRLRVCRKGPLDTPRLLGSLIRTRKTVNLFVTEFGYRMTSGYNTGFKITCCRGMFHFSLRSSRTALTCGLRPVVLQRLASFCSVCPLE
jgi:hypothetical protein